MAGYVSRKLGKLASAAIGASLFLSAQAQEPTNQDRRIEELEKTIQYLVSEMKALKQAQAAPPAVTAQGLSPEEVNHLKSVAAKAKSGDLDRALSRASWMDNLTIGGYGDIHATFTDGDDTDVFDLHRLVLYLGYDFNEWLRFVSEVEVEHGYVSDGDGELVIEQAYAEALLDDKFNVRVGRVLAPLGIINQYHEPTTFNGVERPNFAKYMIPSTWSIDGAGIFGNLTDWLSYEAYVAGGLDGSQFNKDGIRSGRIKERPSLHEPAFTGRVDIRPFANRELPHGQHLRLGLSTFFGGLDNKDQAKGQGSVDADIRILSADYEYTIGKLDLRGAIAHTTIDGASGLASGTPEEMFGWYQEVAYHVMPESWKQGKLAKADAVAFVRYDDYDTQHSLPAGVARTPGTDRQEWTLGMSLFLTPNFVVKADYQILDNDGSDDVDNKINLGIGFNF